MNKNKFLLLPAMLVSLALGGCTGTGSIAGLGAAIPVLSAAANEGSGGLELGLKPGFNITMDDYTPLQLAANAPEYTINGDLSNIENLGQFPNLSQEQRDLIARNGFVVSPTDTEQLFYIYEDNTYKKIPSFITVDSVLQLYHIFYDYSLRNLENDFLYDDLIVLNDNMIKQLILAYDNVDNAEVRNEILKMTAYFGVSQLALGQELPVDFPNVITEIVKQEFELIDSAAGIEKSPLFGFQIDYSLFTVRGHYTRSGELERYFRAMSWYGIVPIPFYNEIGVRDDESAIRAIITTLALYGIEAEGGVGLWENIYSTTCFYVGESDDITPYEIAEIINRICQGVPDLNLINEYLDEFYVELEKARKPEIVSKMEGDATGLQMRFIGQRYIPDSEILQELCEPFKRPFPTGVDVFAVFGSERAEEILNEIYMPTKLWDGYQDNYDRLKDKFTSQSISEQTKNLYGGWLYSLKSLTGRVGEGYPLFMRNTAWEDKALSTALGSWAEIRHDTILYGKQSAAECGGGAEPPELMGYVEPNPEFFNRLLWLTDCTRNNLSERGMLGDNMDYKLDRFADMLLFLRNCALKELNGENLSLEENYSLLTYGGTLEYLSSSIAEADNWFLVESDTDRNMAVVADVHTARDLYLEVGVGAAAEIYVAIPQHGKVYITRGAVFDFYEFSSDYRMTDEDWQQMLKQNPPDRPPFTSSYMDEETAGEVPVPDEPYSTGC